MFVKNDKTLFSHFSYVAADIVAISMQHYAGDDYVYFNSIISFRLRYHYAISHGYDSEVMKTCIHDY